MPGKVRAFIAAEVPEDVKKAVAAAADYLGRKGLHLRWVKPGSMHLTMKFLGDTDESLIPAISAAMRDVAARIAPIALSATGLGAFPTTANARVVWMGLTGETARLVALAGNLDCRLSELGILPEGRPFAAHLTIGRAKERVDGKLLVSAMDSFSASHGEPVSFTVDRLTLFSSELRPHGPLYARLAEVVFK